MTFAILRTLALRRASRVHGPMPATSQKIRCSIAATIIISSLVGCSGQADRTEAADSEVLEAIEKDWETLPDGSRAFHSVRQGAHSGAVDVERCWPKAEGWDCFGAFQLIGGTEINDTGASEVPVEMAMEIEMGGPRFIAARAFKTRLDDPFPHSDEDSPKGGYRCHTFGGGFLNETIFSGSRDGGTTLLSNDSAPGQPYGGSPWSAEFVDKFMHDNGVAPDRPYWNCFHIERLIASGSLATLVTTALTYDELIGPVSAMAP